MDKLIVGDPECPFLLVQDAMILASCLDWIDIARRLQISEETIHRLGRLHAPIGGISIKEVIYQILSEWRGMKGNEAKISHLIAVLEKSNAEDVADKLRKTFEKSDLTFEQIHNIPAPLETLLKKRIPTKVSYYVERKIVSRGTISHDIFRYMGCDVFVISGVDKHQLGSLVSDSLTDTSQNQINKRKITVTFMVLILKSDFEDICKITTQSVHWLHKEKSGTLEWVTTRGSIYTIQQYLDESQLILREDQFLETLESKHIKDKSLSPVCISDSPGMGKSLLLAHIGGKLATTYPERIVIFLVISEFQSLFNTWNKDTDISEMLESLSTCCKLQNSENQILLEKCLHENVKVELLLDGFDEVETSKQKLLSTNLKLLIKSSLSIRLWITTRPHLLKRVENSFETLGYNIHPFDKKDQINFLVSYWPLAQPNGQLDLLRLEQFAEKCLNAITSNLKDKERIIAGIPLQCMLIADVYQKDALNYTQLDNLVCDETFDVTIRSMTDLYSQIVQKKIFDDRNKFSDLSSAGVNAMNKHMYYSLQLKFPEYAESLKKYCESNMTDEEIVKIGIMVVAESGESPRFIHNTFAEYFLALFVVRTLETDFSDDFTNFLLFTLLRTYETPFREKRWHKTIDLYTYDFSHVVICYFIDALLADSDLDYSNLQTKWLPETLSVYMLDKVISHSCVGMDFGNIFKLFDSINLFDFYGKEIFNDELVLISARLSGHDLFSVVCDKFNAYQTTNVSLVRNSGFSVLHMAITKGDYLVVEYLLKNQGFRELVKKGEVKFLLHVCVSFTNNHDLTRIDAKTNIIKALYNLNKRFLEETVDIYVPASSGGIGSTPLLCPYVHFKLLKELIDLGVDVGRVDRKGESFLHKCLNYMSDEEFDEILKYIPQEKLEKIVNTRDVFGRTPLHQVASTWNIIGVKMLIENGANVNIQDDYGNSPLHQVLLQSCNDKQIQIVNILVDNSANVNLPNCKGNTPTLAALKESKYCIGYSLIKYFQFKGWLCSADHYTLALKRLMSSEETIDEKAFGELADMLLDNGADLNWLDENTNTLVHDAAKFENINGLKYLLRIGLCVNAPNKNLQTPLHSAVAAQSSLETMKALVEHGANLKAKDVRGNTVFHVAIEKQWCLKTISFLTDSGHYDNLFQDADSMCYIALKSNLEIFEFICQQYATLTGKQVVTIELVRGFPSLLHAVVYWRSKFFDMGEKTRYLLLSEGFNQLLGGKKFQDVIHWCIRNTEGLSSFQIQNKYSAVKVLVASNPKLLHAKDEQGRNPFQVENVDRFFLDLYPQLEIS